MTDIIMKICFGDLNEDGDEELLIQMEDNPGGYNAVF